MKRTLLIAGLGIAALAGGSMALVFWLTGEPRPAASPPAPIFVAPPSSSVAPPPVTAAPPARPTPRGEAGPSRAASRAGWPAPAEDPSSTPMADRVTRKHVRKALLAAPVQSQLARCVDRDVGVDGGAVAGRSSRARPAVLLIELETLGGELRIVEARVQSWGGASEQAVSCARDALRGRVIANATAEPGRRLSMPFPLNPRSS